MPKHNLRTYKRVHKFEHAVDVERGKIRREINTYLKQSRKADHLIEQLLKNPDDELLIERIASSEHKSSKEHRNARVHKLRLSNLEQQGLT